MNRKYLAALAAVVVIGGGGIYAGTACTCVSATTGTTSGGGGAGWTPVTQANIEVSTTGSDSCTRTSLTTLPLSSGHICQTWDKANSIAQGGDVVAVMGGTYPDDGETRLDPATDSLLLIRQDGTVSSRSSDVTFACGDTNPVTNVGRYLLIESKHITVTGKCFSFRKAIIGDYVTGYFGNPSAPCNNITLNSMNLALFDILGPCNSVTVSNSQIGPSVACYGPGTGTTGQQCHANGTGTFATPTYTGEQYYVNQGIGNNDCCTEPKVHNGGTPNGDVAPQNITITGNTFYGFSSRDPDGGPHAGCLWLGYGNGNGSPLTVSNNTFEQCMTYDIHVDYPGTPAIKITGNTFTPPKDAIRTQTDFSTICTLPCGGGGYWVEIEVKCSDGQNLDSYTITGNNFTGNTGDARGYDLDYGGCSPATYTSLVINNNTIPTGAANNPSQPQP